jgi:hypothetical protein
MTQENKGPEENTCLTPLEDLRKVAREHYWECSFKTSHWSGFVAAAIEAYDPDKITQLQSRIKDLEEEIHMKDLFIEQSEKLPIRLTGELFALQSKISSLEAVVKEYREACEQLINAPHQEHFAARLNDEEMTGIIMITNIIRNS